MIDLVLYIIINIKPLKKKYLIYLIDLNIFLMMILNKGRGFTSKFIFITLVFNNLEDPPF